MNGDSSALQSTSNLKKDSLGANFLSPIEVHSTLLPNGMCIRWSGQDFTITYPIQVWEEFPDILKEVLLDNVAFACTMHLPMVIPGLSALRFNTARPLLEPYFFQNFIRDIPSCTDVDGTNCADALQQFLAIDYEFGSNLIKRPPLESFDTKEKALVAMSFGKDSLLSFAIAEELGLDPEMMYVHEPSMTYERKHKSILAEQFNKQFGKSLQILEHSTGLLRDYDYLGIPKLEYGWGLQNTEYALLMLPFAHHFRASYLLFGNEQSAGMVYPDESGAWSIYPCYDQTHVWSCHLNQMTRALTGGSVQTGSVIEPLMDMMIQRMLIARYPKYAPYQMSCFTDGPEGEQYRWCQVCTVCAKMYLLCAGGGVDPASIGLTQPLLSDHNRHLFPLLGGDTSFSYLRSKMARDEQIFSFYCACLNNFEADLVRSFRSSPLFDEAQRRFEELQNTFCSAYDPISTPAPLRGRLMQIVKEELYSFKQSVAG